MTSRVQKGGTLFRPVVKSRNKTADRPSEPPRQTSVATLESTLNDSAITPPVNGSSQTLNIPDTLSQATPAPSSSIPFPSLNSSNDTRIVPGLSTNANIFSDSSPSQSRGNPVPIVIGVRTQSKQSSQSNLATTTVGPHGVETSVPGSSSIAPSHNDTNQSAPSTIVVGSTRTQPRTVSEPVSSSTYSATQEPDSQALDTTTNSTAKSKRPNPKRRRASAEHESSAEAEDGTPESSTSGKSKGRKKRKPSPLPYDPDADPGEDIDPTTTTMAALCEDTGQGRVSTKAAEILSNHASWKAKNREKRARMKAIMEAKKYGRELEDDELQDAPASQSTSNRDDTAATPATAIVDESGSGFDYSQDLASSRYNVLVRIGPNGETTIDQESLLVDRDEHDATVNYTHVEESDHTKFVNSGTYGKRYRGSRWSAEETELFYDALAQYGENYELIAYVLPGRDRKACKNKFKSEDKKNPARINHCLNNSVPVDMKTLSRMTGKDFSGPVPDIRAPVPPLQIQPLEPVAETPADEIDKPSNKRKRSKSRGFINDDAVVVGNTDNFES
ncbi:hypothetical protein CVT24_012373 [Panaeolus cyanescens]|uniref:Uncharacterized protein n=1 Tax=Panaeolus cyanescens TaxID=181874 RepID=A0A409YYS0_9AGAR|nr:hypothetical protein CVT24_012373 [Panaeolus cyanescens]